jgi:hypothetical protein
MTLRSDLEMAQAGGDHDRIYEDVVGGGGGGLEAKYFFCLHTEFTHSQPEQESHVKIGVAGVRGRRDLASSYII